MKDLTRLDICLQTTLLNQLISSFNDFSLQLCKFPTCDIDIEDDGSVFVTAPDGARGQIAMDTITAITEDIVVGKVYMGKVTELRDFGAFVEIAPGKSGLLHVSQVSDSYVKDIHSVLKVGEQILVKTLPLKDDGKISLTRKGLVAGTADKTSHEPHDDHHHGDQ